jgi:hypothetical protein
MKITKKSAVAAAALALLPLAPIAASAPASAAVFVAIGPHHPIVRRPIYYHRHYVCHTFWRFHRPHRVCGWN